MAENCSMSISVLEDPQITHLYVNEFDENVFTVCIQKRETLYFIRVPVCLIHFSQSPQIGI